jgi:hypothetical protein
MLQFPALMRQWPSPPLIPASTLLPVPATSQEDELLVAMAESDLEDKVLWFSLSPCPFSNAPDADGVTDASLCFSLCSLLS